jgi:hypothetical protein
LNLSQLASPKRACILPLTEERVSSLLLTDKPQEDAAPCLVARLQGQPLILSPLQLTHTLGPNSNIPTLRVPGSILAPETQTLDMQLILH